MTKVAYGAVAPGIAVPDAADRTKEKAPSQEEQGQQAQTQHQKLIANLQARLALAGFSLHLLSDGGFMVARWNYVRAVADVHQLAQFVRQVAGGAA